MGEFFRGRRRQTGLITLLMACVFMGAWMRTLIFIDQMGVTFGESNYFLTSINGCLRWSRYSHIVKDSPLHVYHIDPAYFGSRPLLWKSGRGLSEEEPIDYSPIKWNWHWLSCGFEFGKGFVHGDSPMGVWAIPYWIGIPLTLISAYLLLSKPRPTAQNKTAEPVPEEGV